MIHYRYSMSATSAPRPAVFLKQVNTLNQWERHVKRHGLPQALRGPIPSLAQLKIAVARGLAEVGPALRRKLRNV